MARSRLLVVAALALVAFCAAAALGKGGEGGYVPVPKSSCYTCHASDTPPFQHMVQIVPPQKASAPVGGVIDYTVQVQNAWKAKAIFLAPAMDIAKTPALDFTGAPADVVGNVTHLVIDATTGTPTQVHGANTTYVVPEGVAALDFHIIPKDTNPTTAVHLVMVVTPPGGKPIVIDNGTAGQVLERTFGGPELQKYGAGKWSVGAQMTPFDPTNPGGFRPVTKVDFDAVEDAKFFSGGVQQTLARRIEVEKGASTLVTWHLKVNAFPTGNETLAITLNSTGFYLHTNRATDDFGNFTEGSIVLDVVQQGERVAIVPRSTTIVRPSPVNGPTLITASEAVGYAATFLLLSSIWSGGMFGKASRRQLNSVFGSAKRRVAFHNFLSYGLIAAAIAHMVIFLIEAFYSWTLGLIWGGVAILAMAGLGVTGALQVPMIRKWNYATWRWTHYSMTVAAILFTIIHMLLDGAHFGAVQSTLHWTDPLDPAAAATKR